MFSKEYDNVLVSKEYDKAMRDVGAICTSDKYFMISSMFPQKTILSSEDRIYEQRHCLMGIDLPFHAQTPALIAGCRAKRLRATLVHTLTSYAKRKGLTLQTEMIQTALDVINANATLVTRNQELTSSHELRRFLVTAHVCCSLGKKAKEPQ